MNLSRIVSAAALTTTLLVAICAYGIDKETVLYNFNSSTSGGSGPFGGLVMDQSGNFYGIGLSGIFFELSPNGSGGWNYSDLYNCSSCSYPMGPLVMDHAGNFYTSNYFGDVFEFSPNGSGGWSESLVYNFNPQSRGTGPSNLLIDGGGNLYGVEVAGGAKGVGYVFELSPNSVGGWTLTDLHDFDGHDGAGGAGAAGVVGGLIMDAAGSLYGTTFSGGGDTLCGGICGVVFKLTNNAGVWTETVLHSFNKTGGANPDAPLLMDAAGNLYGTTTTGGTDGFGVVFETSLVSGTWHTRVLYNFTNVGGDGAYPQSALIMDSVGNLYGTTESGGGSTNCSVETDNGCGTAFKLSRSGSNWKESILHAFQGKGDGGFPGAVILDSSGNLYSDAFVGGRYNLGVVFELSPPLAAIGQ